LKAKILYSPKPYFVLAALFSLIPVLNNKYPNSFFPLVSAGWIEIITTLAGVYAAFKALGYWWAILQFRSEAKAWILQVVQNRQVPETSDHNDVVNAGRYITRLVRNVDEDLREIKPDFTLDSLNRLGCYLPELLMEVDDEESGRIRLGIVGVYIGETLCRAKGWEWFFKSDPSLKQFSFLPSVIHKNGKTIDPFEIASKAFSEKKSLMALLGDIQ
jgi:hypothetical protein